VVGAALAALRVTAVVPTSVNPYSISRRVHMYGSVPMVQPERFVYDQSMDVEYSAEQAVSRIAAAIGEPAPGAELLKVALKRKWVSQDLDSRALRLTRTGCRELQARFGIRL
jgi:hypothetical protein